MRWTVSITSFAHGDKNRLAQGAAPGERERLKAEVEAAFRAAADDPNQRGEPLPGDRFRRLLDVGRIRLILDMNLLEVDNPEDDRICWVLGVMINPEATV